MLIKRLLVPRNSLVIIRVANNKMLCLQYLNTIVMNFSITLRPGDPRGAQRVESAVLAPNLDVGRSEGFLLAAYGRVD